MTTLALRYHSRLYTAQTQSKSFVQYIVGVWCILSAFVYVGITNGQTEESMELSRLETTQRVLQQEQQAIEARVAEYRALESVRVRAVELGYVPVEQTVYVPTDHTSVAVR